VEANEGIRDQVVQWFSEPHNASFVYHVAIHVRRGDRKALTYKAKLDDAKLPEKTKKEIESHWAEADEEVEDIDHDTT
jgi:hypothetical protein